MVEIYSLEIIEKNIINNHFTMTPTRCTFKYSKNKIDEDSLFKIIIKARELYEIYKRTNYQFTIRGVFQLLNNGNYYFHPKSNSRQHYMKMMEQNKKE